MYEAKGVIKAIIADLEAGIQTTRKFQVFDLYGRRIENLDDFYTKTNAIYVIYAGENFDVLTNYQMTGQLLVTFVVIDQIIGTRAQTSYFVDQVRDYLTWHDFSTLKTLYPGHDWRPFFPDDIALFGYDTKKGRAIWTITGKIGFDKVVT